ncbi:hypothetical protein BGZ83_002142, partial [Gryganskiella cystojenkinii]
MVQSMSIRLTAISFDGQLNKSVVKFSLLDTIKTTPADKDLKGHTSFIFDCPTTVHNMIFDTLNIDLAGVKMLSLTAATTAGSAYLRLRTLQKLVLDKYSHDVEAICREHNDVFTRTLPLYKPGSYTKLRAAIHRKAVVDSDKAAGSHTLHREPSTSDYFQELGLDDIKVGCVTFEVTLRFKNQSLPSGQLSGDTSKLDDTSIEHMAEIMSSGNQFEKELYLSEGHKDVPDAGKCTTATKGLLGQIGNLGLLGKNPEQTLSAANDIKTMISSFIGDGIDMSIPEFMKGVGVLRQLYERHETPMTGDRLDLKTLQDAHHFARMAIASYGSLACAYFGNSFEIAPKVFVGSDSDRQNVIKNFKLKEEDMLMWHFDQRSALVPSYFIIRDPKSKAMCIVIRGTFNMTDAMTDLVCEYFPYKNGLVHKGMMDTARALLKHGSKEIDRAMNDPGLKTIF